jgi:Tfp pilus assembly protein PilO
MTDTRKWSAAAVVLIAAVFAAGWFLLVSPKRSDAADLKTQTATQDSANVTLQSKLEELKAQQADLPRQRARLAEISTKVPDNPALPSLIRDLTAASRKVGVSLDTLAPAAPVAVSATAPGVVAAAPVAPAAATNVALFQVPLTLNVTGSYFELEQFVNKLEGLKRSFLVTGFSISDATSDKAALDDLTIALTGRVFLSQDTTPAAVTPVAPATAE